MKTLLLAVFMVALAIAIVPRDAGAAGAAAYPSRAVHLIVGYSPGTTSDVFARIIAQTPPEIVAFLSRRMIQILSAADMRERFSQQGAEVVASTSPQFAQFLRSDYEKWNALFHKLGIKPE